MTDLKRVIAYSTMSQIGYMIMGASAGAYVGGAVPPDDARVLQGAAVHGRRLDHRGDGRQPVARPDAGFRKALPFTFACFIIGGLALSGIPPFSGWFSKDDIIAYLNNRGGIYEVLGILGYVGALLTGLYTFRMIFRAFFGDPCPEAVELEHGHLAHAEIPTQPADRRGGGHRRRLPRPRARHRRARTGR